MIVGTLRLTGQDAIDFANAMVHPDPEMIEKRNKFLHSSNISITRTEDGFIADIDNIDLSFLKEEEED